MEKKRQEHDANSNCCTHAHTTLSNYLDQTPTFNGDMKRHFYHYLNLLISSNLLLSYFYYLKVSLRNISPHQNMRLSYLFSRNYIYHNFYFLKNLSDN